MLFLFLYSILYILFYVIVCVILLKLLLFNPLFSIIYVNISDYAYNAILYITTPVFVMFRSPSMIIWRPSGSYLAIRIPATKFSTTVLNRRSRSAATICLQYFAVSNIYRYGHLKRKNSNCLSSKDLPFLHKYCQYNLKKKFLFVFSSLNPEYKLPSRRTISDSFLSSLAKEIEVNLKKDLVGVQFASIATDAWTTDSAQGVLALTVHYIDSEFKLKTAALGIVGLTDHTAKGQAAAILQIIEKYPGLR